MLFHYVPVDYFGAAGSPLIQGLLNQNTNARQRKIHFNNLVRYAKAAKALAKNAEVLNVGVTVNPAGIQQIQFAYTYPTIPDVENLPL